MFAVLEIRGSGRGRIVVRRSDLAVIGGPYTSEGNAITALRGLERRLRPVRIRPCLAGCGINIASQGPGHRLCAACRAGEGGA